MVPPLFFLVLILSSSSSSHQEASLFAPNLFSNFLANKKQLFLGTCYRKHKFGTNNDASWMGEDEDKDEDKDKDED